MLSRTLNYITRLFVPVNEDTEVVHLKRAREDDHTEQGELVKRLRYMTEQNMSAQNKLASENIPSQIEQGVSQVDEDEVKYLYAIPSSKNVSIHKGVVPSHGDNHCHDMPRQRDMSYALVKKRGAHAKIPPMDSQTFSKPNPSNRIVLPLLTSHQTTSDNCQEVMCVNEELKPSGGAKKKVDRMSTNKFYGARSFRQMVETGHVAGNISPYRHPVKPHKSVLDKVIGKSRPNSLASKIGRSFATLNCFRPDEKELYQQILNQHQSGRSFSNSKVLSNKLSINPSNILVPPNYSDFTYRLLGTSDSCCQATGINISGSLDIIAASSNIKQNIIQTPPGSHLSKPEKKTDHASGAPCTVLLDRDTSHDPDIIIDKVITTPCKPSQLQIAVSRELQHLEDVQSHYEESEILRKQQITEEEARICAGHVQQVHWERHLSVKLRKQMSIALPVAIEAEQELSDLEEEKDEELIELTQQMEKQISAALKPAPPDEIMSEAFNLRITRHDLQTLNGLNWLNDEVILFYMTLIMERSKRNDNLPKVYCFNTFFYGKIVSQGHGSVKRWTRKVDVFAQDLLFIPVHLGMHWCMICVDVREKTVAYYDSMGSDNNRALQAVLKYLRDEHQDKKKVSLNTTSWQCSNVKEIPQQMNGSDCGMFSCKFAEYLSRDARIGFMQENMPYFRRRMVYEIITKTLL